MSDAAGGSVARATAHFAPETAKPAQWFGNVTGAFSASFPDACP